MNDQTVGQSSSEWFALNSRQLPIWLETTTSDQRVSPQYGGWLRLDTRLDVKAFEDAISAVMASHDALRLRIDRNEPRQRIVASVRPPVEHMALGSGDREAAFKAQVERLFEVGLELDDAPLFEVYLGKAGDELWFVAFRFHHLIADGLSCALFWRHLATFYDDIMQGRATIDAPSHSVVDFCARDAAYLASDKLGNDLAYWEARFEDLPPPLFESASSSSPVPDGEIRAVWQTERAAYDAFLGACDGAGVRAASVLALLLGLCVTPAHHEQDVVMGLAVAGRAKSEAAAVGQFGKLIPLRFRIQDQPTLVGLAARLEAQLLRDYRHHKLPLDMLARKLDLARKGRRTLFDVFFSFMPADRSNFDFPVAGSPIAPVIWNAAEGFSLALYVIEANRDKAPFFEFTHNPDVLGKGDVDRIKSRFLSLIEVFTRNPHICALELERLRLPSAVVAPPTTPDDPEPVHPAWTVGIAATFTVDPIVPTLKFWLKTLGIAASVDVVGYNQVFQALLDGASLLRTNARGVNLVIVRIEDWLRNRAADDPEGDDTRFVVETAESLADAFAPATRTTPVVWFLLIAAPSPRFASTGPGHAVQKAGEDALIASTVAIAGLEVMHYDRVRDLYVVTEEFDQVGDELGHAPYNAGAYVAMGTALVRAAHRRLRRPVKVIVVDCDNTLWAGIVGEDGPSALRIEATHRQLQRRLVKASQAGVLVCLASKNEPADVRAVFDTRDDMVLKLDHIVAAKVNWQPKSANILELAAELDLGLNSFVFLDDNPIEIADVEAGCPGITAIRVPEGGATRAFFIAHLWLLDAGPGTAEDTQRTRFYRENAERSALRRTTADYGGFIDGLKVEIAIETPDEAQLERCAQLTERTTQFNIDARKLGIADLVRLRDGNGDACVRAVSVSDRFGDYGLVGLFVAQRSGSRMDVTTLLMSCRVLGRGVEHRMVAELGLIAERWGCETVRLAVVTSSRNQPVRQFLATLDAERTEEPDGPVVCMTSSAAASTRFRSDARQVELPKAPISPSQELEARFVPAVSSRTWARIAADLDNVIAIGRETRATLVAPRSSQTPYRPPQTTTELILATLLADAIEVDRVGIDDNFISMGLDSLPAVQLIGRVRKRLGINVPVRSLFETPTVATLAASLSNLEGSSDFKAITPLQLGRVDRTPLFCFHPIAGDAVSYMRLARALGADQPVYGLQAAGQVEGEPLPHSIEEMTASYVDEIRRVQEHGPYFLLGWSFGGFPAYEAACRLQSMGEEVGQLLFLDSYPPVHAPNEPELSYDQALDAMVNIMAEFAKHIRGAPQLDSEEDKAQFRSSLMGIDDFVKIGQRLGLLPFELSKEEAQLKVEVCRNLWHLERRWQPRGFDGDVTYFRPTKRPDDGKKEPWRWRTWASGRLHIVDVECHHLDMVLEPHVLVVAERIKEIMAPALVPAQ